MSHEELVQVSSSHELKKHAHWLRGQANTDQAYNVGVTQLRHQVNLATEVLCCLGTGVLLQGFYGHKERSCIGTTEFSFVHFTCQQQIICSNVVPFCSNVLTSDPPQAKLI